MAYNTDLPETRLKIFIQVVQAGQVKRHETQSNGISVVSEST
jgi:hypothetical protein